MMSPTEDQLDERIVIYLAYISKIVPGRKEALNTYLMNEGIGFFFFSSPGRTELCHTFHKYEITKQDNAVLGIPTKV